VNSIDIGWPAGLKAMVWSKSLMSIQLIVRTCA
jgi:hypothetical protein